MRFSKPQLLKRRREGRGRPGSVGHAEIIVCSSSDLGSIVCVLRRGRSVVGSRGAHRPFGVMVVVVVVKSEKKGSSTVDGSVFSAQSRASQLLHSRLLRLRLLSPRTLYTLLAEVQTENASTKNKHKRNPQADRANQKEPKPTTTRLVPLPLPLPQSNPSSSSSSGNLNSVFKQQSSLLLVPFNNPKKSNSWNARMNLA